MKAAIFLLTAVASIAILGVSFLAWSYSILSMEDSKFCSDELVDSAVYRLSSKFDEFEGITPSDYSQKVVLEHQDNDSATFVYYFNYEGIALKYEATSPKSGFCPELPLPHRNLHMSGASCRDISEDACQLFAEAIQRKEHAWLMKRL